MFELTIQYFLTFTCAYLLGAIPTAYIFGRVLKNIDIREHGSGNVGATNAFRVLGKMPGSLCLFLDILKGVLATTLVPAVFGVDGTLNYIFLSVIAVCGHNWTCFLNFSGGKGIATTLGVLIGLTIQIDVLQPVVGLTVISWIIPFVITGYVSLSSIVAALALPILMLVFKAPILVLVLGVLFCVFVIYRHRPNIVRLKQGIENQVKFHFIPLINRKK